MAKTPSKLQQRPVTPEQLSAFASGDEPASPTPAARAGEAATEKSAGGTKHPKYRRLTILLDDDIYLALHHEALERAIADKTRSDVSALCRELLPQVIEAAKAQREDARKKAT